MMDQDLEKIARIAQIRDVAAEVFRVKPGEVEAAQSFETDLDTNSLLAVDLLLGLEQRFGVSIENAEIHRLMTNLHTAYEVVAEKAGW